jgi:GxxExxY protein
MNKMNKMEAQQLRHLTHSIIGAAMRVHTALGPGFLESVYKNALSYELTLRQLTVQIERRIEVRYEGIDVGEFVADLVVNDLVILEIKAVRTLALAHEVQLVNYLTATGLDIGLLFNFGTPHLQFKRKARILTRAIL